MYDAFYVWSKIMYYVIIFSNIGSNNIYFSAKASIFLIAVLELGSLFWAKYKYMSLKQELIKPTCKDVSNIKYEEY